MAFTPLKGHIRPAARLPDHAISPPKPDFFSGLSPKHLSPLDYFSHAKGNKSNLMSLSIYSVIFSWHDVIGKITPVMDFSFSNYFLSFLNPKKLSWFEVLHLEKLEKIFFQVGRTISWFFAALSETGSKSEQLVNVLI